MRKPLRTVTFWMSLLVAVSAATHALCEQTYVSIAAAYVKAMPDRWVGRIYVVEHGAPNQLEKGDTVSVDVPIVVPEVDAVPVVRITWEPPAEGLDGSLEVVRDDWNAKRNQRQISLMDELTFPVLEDHMTFTPELPWEEAPAIAMAEFQKWMPFMKDKELTSVLPGLLWRFKWKRLSGHLLLYDLSWHTASHCQRAFSPRSEK